MYQTPYAYPNPYQNYSVSQSNYNNQQIVKVHGRNGADSYQMPPNSSALLLDENNPIIYLAQSDGAGYKTITAYDINPHKEVEPIDMQNLEQRIARLEERLNESNTSNVKQWKPEQTKSNATNGTNNQVSK